MAHAEKCPICEGRGHTGFVETLPYKHNGTADGVCRACEGKGWVELADSPYYTIQPFNPLYGAPNTAPIWRVPQTICG